MGSVLEFMGWIIFLFHMPTNFTLAEPKLPALYPDTILSACESSCVVLTLADKTANEVLNVLQSLADVSFRNDPSVIVGKLASQTDLNFFWPDSQRLKVQNGLKADVLNQSVFLFGRLKKDRNCLLVPQKQLRVPSVFQHDLFHKTTHRSDLTISDMLSKIVIEINKICGTFRNVDGSINFKGLHRNEILDNLFPAHADSKTNEKHVEVPGHNYFPDNEQNQCSKYDSNNCKAIQSDEYQYDECEKITMPSPAHFFHEYISLSKPVIITGATNNWLAFQKWTKSFLKEKFGKTRVHVKATPDGEYEGVQDRSLWEGHKHFRIPKEVEEQLPFPDLVVERPASLDMRFSEFLDLIENISRGDNVNMSAYLEYSSIADYFPELKSDIAELEFISMLELASLNIWLSDGNTIGKLHFDPFDNLLCQVV